MTTYKTVVEGKGGIVARVVADSINKHDIITKNPSRIITFECEYPRWILAEINTHKMISKNTASSRAIPIEKMIDSIKTRPAMPVFWGRNQPGMSAKEECIDPVKFSENGIGYRMTREQAWSFARDNAIKVALAMHQAGYHKQLINRLIENFTLTKSVFTATEWDNLFWLRNHPDAQPEFQELARVMLEAARQSEPKVLTMYDWHTPYFGDGYWLGTKDFEPYEGSTTLGEALKVSVSCCAQVSYRKNDDSIQKAEDIYKRLVTSVPVHASPTEHQARPFNRTDFTAPFTIEKATMQPGKLTTDENDWWSGNIRNWLQFRQTVKDNVCNRYEPFRTINANQ